jgi:hypothetical protein
MIGCSHEQGNLTGQATSASGNQGTGDLLHEWCTDCHAPPQPDSHAPREWPNIVMRMQDHRIVKGLAAIPQTEMDNVIGYLQTHAQ